LVKDAPALYSRDDPFVVAIATDAAQHLPSPTGLPVLDLNHPEAVADFLLQDPKRYELDLEPHLS
jgi:molybdopterin-guanine dinucleotide biosynthesis protein B